MIIFVLVLSMLVLLRLLLVLFVLLFFIFDSHLRLQLFKSQRVGPQLLQCCLFLLLDRE